MIWRFILILVDLSDSLQTKPDGTLKIDQGSCNGVEKEIDMSLEWPYTLDYPVGSQIKLCCAPLIPAPLNNKKVNVTWFYSTTAELGQFNKQIKNDSTKQITDHQHYNTGGQYHKSLLIIDPLSLSDEGVFVCLVNTSTLDNKLHVSRFLQWFKISVYNTKKAFKIKDEDFINKKKNKVTIKTASSLSYALDPYRCDCDEGVKDCNLVVDVTVGQSKNTQLQVVNIPENHELIIWNPGTYIGESVTLTAVIYCPNTKNEQLTRSWEITENLLSEKRKKVMYQSNAKFLTLQKFSHVYCLGTCDDFYWTVLLGKEKSGIYQELNSSMMNLQHEKNFDNRVLTYQFIEVDLLYGDDNIKKKFMRLNVTVSILTNSVDKKGFDIAFKCGCSNTNTERLDGFALGIPTQRTDMHNCLNSGDVPITASYVEFKTRRSPCCAFENDPGISTTLYKNGIQVYADEDDEQYMMDEMDPNAVNAWYQKYSGFYQCFVGGYQDHLGEFTIWQTNIDFQTRTIDKIEIIALNGTKPSVTPHCDDFVLEDDCDALYDDVDPMYKYKSTGDHTHNLLVLNGTCIQISIQTKSWKESEITWQESTKLKTYEDWRCDDARDGQYDEIKKTIYIPYDLVTKTSSWFIKVEKDFTINATAGEKQQNFAFTVADFKLRPVNCSSGILNISCRAWGFPKPKMIFYAVESGKTPERVNTADCPLYPEILEDGYVRVCMEVFRSAVSDIEGYKIFATNGHVNRSAIQEVEKTTAPPNDDSMLIIVIMMVVLLVCFVIVLVWCVYKKLKKRHNKDYLPLLPLDKMCYEYHTLHEGEQVGKGNFGEVYKGYSDSLDGLEGKRMEVVIKKVKMLGNYEGLVDDLWREKDMLLKVRGHQNVCLIYGYCKSPPAIVIEYCPLGSLDKLLKESRKFTMNEVNDGYAVPDEMMGTMTFTSEEILDFGRQIAAGMDFVGSKGIIHRDLAARNVIVSKENNAYIMKIIDFGLSRLVNEEGMYMRTIGKQIPIKWIAPESFNDEYTIKSDVWSFGVTLWEIVTLGAEPYHDIPNRELMARLRNGLRLRQPAICEDNLYRVMENCWELSPEKRRNFADIVTVLTLSLEDSGNYLSTDIYTNNLDVTYFMDAATLEASNANNTNNINNCNNDNDNDNIKSPSLGLENDYSPEPLPENVTITPNSNLNVNNHNLRNQALKNRRSSSGNLEDSDDADDRELIV